MRKELDDWRFWASGEDSEQLLSRFLIGFEELRVRLAPSKYPNFEVSDEGNLWFNVDTAIGNAEVFAFPFGFQGAEAPSVAVSFPRKAEDVDQNLLSRLHRVQDDVADVLLFSHKTASTKQEILDAFGRNQHPPLTFTSDFDDILKLKASGSFFSYLGVHFSVQNKTVLEAEHIIRQILSFLARV